MKNIDRYIYLGDIHGSKYFKSFIDKYRDGKTKFYFTGDLFDRGYDSFEVLQTLKELHKTGEVDGVLGNHDLFFLLGIGPEYNTLIRNGILANNGNMNEYDESFYVFKKLLEMNGGDRTIESFKKGYKYYGHIGLYESDRLNYSKEVASDIDFLFENFGLILRDNLGNVIVHGGIPILSGNGILVGDYNNDGLYQKGFDYVDFLNTDFKKLSLSTIKLLSANNEASFGKVINSMSKEGALTDGYYVNNYSKELLPIWFNNEKYESNPIVQKTLFDELDRIGSKRLFCGHWGVDKTFSDFVDISKYDRIIRLDRSWRDTGKKNDCRYGNFGYAIINNNNELLEVGEAHNALGLIDYSK